MILVIGDPDDPVINSVCSVLSARHVPYRLLDERALGDVRVNLIRHEGRIAWRVKVGDDGSPRPVGAIFVRHRPGPVSSESSRRWHASRRAIDQLLHRCRCPVINRPGAGACNWSKPLQLSRLNAAGFNVPPSLVTNEPAQAWTFLGECGGTMVAKGVSAARSAARVIKAADVPMLSRLGRAPLLLQPFIAGAEFRVTVVGSTAAVTLVSRDGAGARHEPSTLPAALLARCVAFTQQEGLVLSAFDFRVSPQGVAFVLEMNAFPQITDYESTDRPYLSWLVVDELKRMLDDSDVLV